MLYFLVFLFSNLRKIPGDGRLINIAAVYKQSDRALRRAVGAARQRGHGGRRGDKSAYSGGQVIVEGGEILDVGVYDGWLPDRHIDVPPGRGEGVPIRAGDVPSR